VHDKHFRPLPRPGQSVRRPFTSGRTQHDTSGRTPTPGSSWPCARSPSTSAGPGHRPTRPGSKSLNGHLKAEYPHLLAIRDPATLRAELKITRAHYNGVRLHAGIGYVTPNDEHEGRGPAIRKARQAGLEQARLRRLARHRQARQTRPTQGPDDVG